MELSDSTAWGSALRRCISEPIPLIADAARYLDAAVSAHLIGKSALADELIRTADIPEIRSWTKSIWANSEIHLRSPPSLVSSLPKDQRVKVRMPTLAEKLKVHKRDGYNCRFCGMPVIRPEIRGLIRAAYPDALPWGSREIEQHAAFQAMWAQYDHVLPHARGGTNDLDNLVLTCAPCNFGRGGYTLEEVGVQDPRERSITKSPWDGLERFA
jgi:hypothetical protein